MKVCLPVLLVAGFFAQPVAAQVYGDTASCASGSTAPAVLVYYDGLKDRKGKLRLELFPDNDTDFLADDFVLTKAGKAFRRIELTTPQSGVVALCLRAPKAGRYTMAMIHDRDNLRKFSFSVDGAGFPGNPKLGWSKPKAAKAMVNIGNGVTVLRVRMRYFSGLGFSPVGK
jgi:uncharacterized protein (DUF2141 family)